MGISSDSPNPSSEPDRSSAADSEDFQCGELESPSPRTDSSEGLGLRRYDHAILHLKPGLELVYEQELLAVQFDPANIWRKGI